MFLEDATDPRKTLLEKLKSLFLSKINSSSQLLEKQKQMVP